MIKIVVSNSKVEGAKTLGVIQQRFLDKKISLEGIDYLIFSSKNGVLALDRVAPSWKKIPSLTIGKATSKKVRELGGIVEYEAKKFYGDSFAKEIKKRFDPSKTYLYIRPKIVSSNLSKILKEAKFNLVEAVLYETVCRECKELPPLPNEAYLIFSSPSSVRCFFRCYEWKEGFKAVAIGAKTAKALSDNVKKIILFEGLSLKEIVESLS